MTASRPVLPNPVRATLQAIVDEASPNAIRADVAAYALDFHGCDPARFFADLSRNGCAYGMVNHLISFADTRAWFDRHYDEIEDLRQEMEESLGEPLRIPVDLKTWLAWFAFEEVACRIARDDLGLDLL